MVDPGQKYHLPQFLRELSQQANKLKAQTKETTENPREKVEANMNALFGSLTTEGLEETTDRLGGSARECAGSVIRA